MLLFCNYEKNNNLCSVLVLYAMIEETNLKTDEIHTKKTKIL